VTASIAFAPSVPYDDFARRYEDWRERTLALVREVGESDEFILKSRVQALEAAIAERTGVAHGVAVSNGTAALMLSLIAVGIGPGDDVLTPAFSFISSASAIALAGATPVFVDVDPDTWCLDPAASAAAVGPATRAVIPVHLFGQHADMPAFAALGRSAGPFVIEDSAVAFGGQLRGAPAGSLGDVGVFSFFPGKPLGGIGDGGIVVTDDPGIAASCRMLRNHGQDPTARFLHHAVGFNARLDELTAGFLLMRLPGLEEWLERRRAIAARYDVAFAPLAPAIRIPTGVRTGAAVYSYVIRAARRKRLIAHLGDRGIGSRVLFPQALPHQPLFWHLGLQPGTFPVAEALARECLALPLHPEMSDGDVARVIEAVIEFVRVSA
jgi:dTDP-4-amino-4,6-dideoxygalactose transaminase